MLDASRQNLRYGLRQLNRTPLSTLVATASLAAAITVAVTAFSLVNTILLRPLPVDEPGRIVHVFASNPQDFLPEDYLYGGSAYADVADYAGSGAFSGVVAWRSRQATVGGGDAAPARLTVTFATPNYFDVLGVDMASGRRPGSDDEFGIVISDVYRRRAFDTGDDVIGSAVQVNGIHYTVIGVAPRPFRGLDRFPESVGWISGETMRYVYPGPRSGGDLTDRGDRSWQVAARLVPGVTREVAAARLARTASMLSNAHPMTWRSELGTPRRTSVLTHRERTLSGDDDMAALLVVLAAGVGVILLLACTNVAGLLLARSVTRRHEIAVRLALGASRRQLSAQLLTESLLLALLGGGAGVVGSRLGVALLGRTQLFGSFDLSLDWRIFAATTVLCFLSALLFGITPLGQALRVDVKTGLSGVGVISERGGVRGRLIALQVCVSCLLVVIGVHASRGVLSLVDTDSGELNGLVAARLDVDARALDSIGRRQYLEHAVTTMRGLPGVTHTAFSAGLPTLETTRPAGPLTTPAGSFDAGHQWIDEEYFEALGMELLVGTVAPTRARSGFPAPGDGPQPAVVNRSLAQRLGGDPIGAILRLGVLEVMVTGVVEDHGGRNGGNASLPAVYQMRWDWARYGGGMTLLARVTPGMEAAVAARFGQAVRARYPALVPPHVNTVRAQLRDHYAPQRFIANAAMAVGAMQLILAALGLYSLLLYAALARTREIGLRMALGARPQRASLTVMADGLHYVLGGSALGIALAVPAAIVASHRFLGADATDPLPFVAALFGIAISTAAAAWIPARRAARVQPMSALRVD